MSTLQHSILHTVLRAAGSSWGRLIHTWGHLNAVTIGMRRRIDDWMMLDSFPSTAWAETMDFNAATTNSNPAAHHATTTPRTDVSVHMLTTQRLWRTILQVLHVLLIVAVRQELWGQKCLSEQHFSRNLLLQIKQLYDWFPFFLKRAYFWYVLDMCSKVTVQFDSLLTVNDVRLRSDRVSQPIPLMMNVWTTINHIPSNSCWDLSCCWHFQHINMKIEQNFTIIKDFNNKQNENVSIWDSQSLSLQLCSELKTLWLEQQSSYSRGQHSSQHSDPF